MLSLWERRRRLHIDIIFTKSYISYNSISHIYIKNMVRIAHEIRAKDIYRDSCSKDFVGV